MNASAARHAGHVVVPVDAMGDFRKRLTKLNAKAERFGLDPIVASEPVLRLYKICHTASVQADGEDIEQRPAGRPVPHGAEVTGLVQMAEMDLDYPIVKMGDWEVVARIEAVPGADHLVFVTSGDEADTAQAEQHRCQAMDCEHCGVSRQRKVAFLLKSDAGYKKVGSTCLEDFTGVDPAAALFLAKLHEFVRWDPGEGGTPRANVIATDTYLMRVAFLVEQHGFTSSAASRLAPFPRATWEEAVNLPWVMQHDGAMREAFDKAADRLQATACAVREWYAMNTSTEGFDANVRTLLAGDLLRLDAKHHLAFVAAAVPSFRRHQDRQRQQAAAAVSRHVGEPGERCSSMLKVVRTMAWETQYGTQRRVVLEDRAGNRLTWKTSTALPEAFREDTDQWHDCQFRIKAHDDYQGTAQTVVTHMKVIGPALEEVVEDTPEAAGMHP